MTFKEQRNQSDRREILHAVPITADAKFQGGYVLLAHININSGGYELHKISRGCVLHTFSEDKTKLQGDRYYTKFQG